MRRLSALLLLLLLGALLVLVWPTRIREAAPPAPVLPATAESAEPVMAAGAPAEEPAAPVRRSAIPDPEPEVPAPAPESAGGVEIHGTLVVVDALGTERTGESGLVDLVAWRGSGGRGFEVEVRDGAWSARVEADVEIGVGAIEAGGRPALLEEEDARFPVTPERTLELRARWLLGTLVHVLDATTDVALDGVTLARGVGWPRMDMPHPGDVAPERVELTGARSPIELAPDANRYTNLHVHAPDHAWAILELDAKVGGERIVRLGPGGTLEVELLGGVLDPGTLLRVRVSGLGRPFAELDVGDRRRITLAGLPAGEVRVGAEIGPWWESPLVLGEGRVEVPAGGGAELVLELAPPPSAPPVALGGEIHVPAAWGLDRFMLVVKLLDNPLDGREEILRLTSRSLRRDTERRQVWHWRLEDMQAGRYELELFPLYTSMSLEVPAGGREDILFVLPEPVEVSVRVVDAVSGRDAGVDMVLWNSERPEWVRGGGCERAELEPETGLWHLRAPAGRVELHTRGGPWRPVREVHAIGDRPREVTLHVERQFRILLHLSENGAPVAWPEGTQPVAEPVGGGEAQRGWCPGRATCWLVVDTPGTFLVTIPELPGYQPVPVQEVFVGEAASEVEHVIELRRAH